MLLSKDTPLMSATYTVTQVEVQYFVMLKYFDGSHTDAHSTHYTHAHTH